MQPLQRDRGAPGQQLQRPEPQVWEGGGGGSAAQGEGEERPAAWAQRGGGGSAEPREGLLPPDAPTADKEITKNGQGREPERSNRLGGPHSDLQRSVTSRGH